MGLHTHRRTDELHVFFVPIDTDEAMGMKVVSHDWRSIKDLLGGYIEEVSTELMPVLDCGCRVVMLVDEEGMLKGLGQNLRASSVYPHGAIRGPAVFVAEGPVKTESDVEVSWFSLPQSFMRWEGPGTGAPSGSSVPWEN